MVDSASLSAQRIGRSEPPHMPGRMRHDVERFVDTVRSGAAIIAASVFVCAGLAVAYLLLIPPTFVATGRILVEPKSVQIVNANSASRTQGEIGVLEVESQIYVLTSKSVLDRVIEKEGLVADPEFGARPEGLISSLLGLSSEPDDRRDKAMRELERVITVGRNQSSLVMTVSVRASSPERAQRLSDALMAAYLAEEGHERTKLAGRVAGSVYDRLGELRERVRDAEERVERYRRDYGIVTTGGQPVLEQQVNQVTREISTVGARVEQLNSIMVQVRGIRTGVLDLDALPEAQRTGTIETLRSRLALARQAAASLGANLGPRHPARQAAEAEATEVRSLVDRELEAILQATTTELDRARSAEAGLRTRLTELKAELTRINAASVGLRELVREVDANRSIYEAFLARSRELHEEGRLQGEPARIINWAIKPSRPAGPSPILLLAASIIFGLGIGTTLAWLRDQIFDRR
jgi:uncharacterized protein involved in exopolysaccharide biosynthesis